MKQALKVAAFAVALAAVAGALAGAASVVRSIPGAAVDDPAGIAYTETLTIGRYWRSGDHNVDDHATSNVFNGSILVDVRGAVDKLGLQSGTWDARLSCPTPVGKQGDETFSRSSVALSDGVTFAVSLSTPVKAAFHEQVYRCWLRVKIGLPEDGTTIVVRDAMLPVQVVHAQRNPT